MERSRAQQGSRNGQIRMDSITCSHNEQVLRAHLQAWGQGTCFFPKDEGKNLGKKGSV